MNDSAGVQMFYVDSDGNVTQAGSFTPTTLILPNSAAPAQTTEASVAWDTDSDNFVVGTGSEALAYPRGDAYIIKSAAETVTGSTALQNDNDFLLTVSTNTDYLVEMFLHITTNATADWKFAWTLTGMTFDSLYTSTPNSTVVYGVTTATASASATAIAAADDNYFHAIFTIHSGSTGGTLNFQWAQNTSDGVNTIVTKNSWMRYRKLAAT